MTYQTITCSSCHNQLEIQDNADTVICVHCGNSIYIKGHTQVSIGANIENLLILAKSASSSGNYNEAYSYFNKILEIAPTNNIAWYGKGEAAGWLSTLKEYRFREMLLAFNNAIAFTDDSEKNNLMHTCSTTTLFVARACHKLAKNHLIEFSNLSSVCNQYWDHCTDIIELCDLAFSFNPNDYRILELAVEICHDNISGVIYKQNNKTQKVFILLDDNHKNTIKQVMNHYIERILLFNPSYNIPVLTENKSNCFIITATMGNENNVIVSFLRKFRDDILIKTNHGNTFIKWYYQHGPNLAKTIEKHTYIKPLVFLSIVLPATTLAIIIRLFLKAKSFINLKMP